MVDAPSVKGRLDKLRQTRVGFSWTNLLSPQLSEMMIGSPVRPHKVRYKVRYYYYYYYYHSLSRTTLVHESGEFH